MTLGRTTLGLLIIGLWLVVGVMAMADTPRNGEPPVNPDGTAYKTPDDKLAEIGVEVPGFGGMFRDPDNSDVLKVFMLDTTGQAQKADLADELSEKFPSAIRSGGIEVIQGQYSMSQLSAWYKEVLRAIGTGGIVGNGFVMSDLEEDKNRIEIGVDSEEAVATVEGILSGLPDVPREAVRVTIRSRMEWKVGPGSNVNSGTQTVRDKIRPLIGGIQPKAKMRGSAPSDSS